MTDTDTLRASADRLRAEFERQQAEDIGKPFDFEKMALATLSKPEPAAVTQYIDQCGECVGSGCGPAVDGKDTTCNHCCGTGNEPGSTWRASPVPSSGAAERAKGALDVLGWKLEMRGGMRLKIEDNGGVGTATCEEAVMYDALEDIASSPSEAISPPDAREDMLRTAKELRDNSNGNPSSIREAMYWETKAASSEPCPPDALSADAADLLEQYAGYIRTVKADDLERHPYLPEIERVAAALRADGPPDARAVVEACAKVADNFEGTAAMERCDDPLSAAGYAIGELIRAKADQIITALQSGASK